MRAFSSDRIGRVFRTGRRQKAGKNRLRKRVVRWFLVASVAILALGLLLVLPFRWITPPATAFMLQDRSGRIPVLYDWVAWADIGASAKLAVVAAEDQKFANHFGFDVKSIRDSVMNYSDGARLRGASTITQQVAKNMYLWPGKSFLRKGIEAYFTVLIESSWPKKRILEIYLNIAELGPGIYGVGAAAEFYFEKSPDQLSDAEAALFAAVLPSPNRLRVDSPTPYVRERQSWIATHMRRMHREKWLILLE